MKVGSSMFTFSKGHSTHKHFLVMFIETLPPNAYDIWWGALVPIIAVKLLYPVRGLVTRR